LGLVGRHPVISGGLVGLAVVAALILTVFAPQKLFLDTTVTEAPPPIAAPGEENRLAPTPAPAPAPAQPSVLATGEFRSLAHEGSGTALLLTLPSGQRVLRLERLDVENGPDLRVYLSQAGADVDRDELGRLFVDLGTLKGNKGDQNYAVPADTDLAEIRSAVVWCRRFSVAFAVAPLEVG
jgi:hypothetical protein